jgi:hypothetical protein
MLNYYVSGRNVYGDFDTENEIFPLLRITVDEAGAFTVTEAGGGIAALPAGTLVSELWAVARMFQIATDNPYEPLAVTDAPATIALNLDAGAQVVNVTGSPADGDWSLVASDTTGVCTVSETGGAFTLTPISAGSATITGRFTPTDTDFAVIDISMEVVVTKRTVTVDPIRDYQLTIGEGGEGATNEVDIDVTVLSGLAPAAVEAYVSDGAEVTVAVEGGVITVTPSAEYVGKSTITVHATRTNCDPSVVPATFEVEVCATQVGAFATTPSAVSNKKHGESTTLTFAPASGAEIVEFKTSDSSRVAITAYSLAAGTVTIRMDGVAGETANITAVAHKRGLGQRVSGNVAITIAAN